MSRSNKFKRGKLFSNSHPNLNRDWVIGEFIEDDRFKSNGVEFKYQHESAGLIREPKPVMREDVKTIAILIDGKLRMNFGDEDIILSERGDYIWWEPDAPHLFEYLEDSLVISLRWPSGD